MATEKVSLIASAVRIPFYKTFLDSLVSTTVPIEVVFAGHNTEEEIAKAFEGFNILPASLKHGVKITYIDYKNIIFKYVHTEKIKPAQCYEVARRLAIGETIAWTADDCEYSPDLMGKAYRFWKDQQNEKVVLSIQTIENGMFCDMKVHSFFGCQYHTPLMAPLALMSAELMSKLGGFDRRYICGQYENDAVMRVIEDGGKVVIFGDKENFINIDHYRRHGIVRPFATGYNHDREILEGSWTDGNGKVFLNIQRPFEPYSYVDITKKSQSFSNQNWV